MAQQGKVEPAMQVRVPATGDTAAADSQQQQGPGSLPTVALLTNFLPPYRIPVLRELAAQVGDFRILVSTPMEPNRAWDVDWEDLPVTVQRCIMVKRRWDHPYSFSEELYVHVPFRTVGDLRESGADVVISAELGFRTLLAAIYCKLNRRRRLIIWATLSEHSEVGRGRVRHALRRLLFNAADAVLVHGQSAVRYVRGFGVSEEKVFIAPGYGVAVTSSLSRVTIERSPESAYRLLFVGQMIERKGLAGFLDALVRWADRNPSQPVELTMVGDGPLRSTLELTRTPSNLKLTWLGNISYSELPAVYAASGIFVFPTLADEWGVVVNEAFAAGLPVLGSLHSQAVEELVVDGENGWTFDPTRPEEMGEALDRALSTPIADLMRMREAARTATLELTPQRLASTITEAIRFSLRK